MEIREIKEKFKRFMDSMGEIMKILESTDPSDLFYRKYLEEDLLSEVMGIASFELSGIKLEKAESPKKLNLKKMDLIRMWEKQGGLCYYCGIHLDKIEIDHKIAVSKGGSNELGNLALSCNRCNTSKGTMSEEQFRKKLHSKK